MDRDKGATASPPTDRVVAVIELLAGRDEACTIAEVADALGLSRSTVGAVLGSLDAHGGSAATPTSGTAWGRASQASVRLRVRRRACRPDWTRRSPSCPRRWTAARHSAWSPPRR